MPWKIIKRKDQFCVAKHDSSSPIKGGCHNTLEEARAHKIALNINVHKKGK